jgi:hypothetical protein
MSTSIMVLIRHSSQWNHSSKVVLNGQRDNSALFSRVVFLGLCVVTSYPELLMPATKYLFTKQQLRLVEVVGNLERESRVKTTILCSYQSRDDCAGRESNSSSRGRALRGAVQRAETEPGLVVLR